MKRNQYYRPASRNHMRKKIKESLKVMGIAVMESVLVLVTFLMIVAGLMLLSAQAKACDGIYLKIGAGYKLSEMDSIIYQGREIEIEGISPYAARFELGYQRGMLTMGGAHYSQWDTGWPFNDEKEPGNTSLFVDLRFDLWRF